uniref:DUF4371 domain-containing protein n=1 Tax=Octopus bimaculoides TaxID=37653 RepID=A0A0L8I7Q5_OCTBM
MWLSLTPTVINGIDVIYTSTTQCGGLRTGAALRIAKAKRPYIIGETLVIGEPAAKKVAQVPLSNDTIARRIHDLAHDMEDQLIGQIILYKLDECTDFANQAVLMVSEVFKTVSDYIVNKCGMDFKFCVGVCSNGAAVMTGRHSRVVTQIKTLVPECKSTHCSLHRENYSLHYVIIWELIINSSYCMPMNVGYRWGNSCQECLSYKTSLPSFFRTKIQIGHNCSEIQDRRQKRKPEAWTSRVSRDCYDMFHQLATITAEAGEDLNITSLRNVIREHLMNLADRFQIYFPAEEDPRRGNGWIRNPFIPLQDDFSVIMEDKLLELAGDEGLKRSFETTISLGSF